MSLDNPGIPTRYITGIHEAIKFGFSQQMADPAGGVQRLNCISKAQRPAPKVAYNECAWRRLAGEALEHIVTDLACVG